MKNLILGFFIIAILLGTTNAYAQCSCAYAGESEADEAKRSDVAFVGEVVEVKKIENTKDQKYNYFDVTFKIKKSLKEDSIKEVTIRNISSGNSDFDKKESYIVFATIYDGFLQASIYCCTYTRKISGIKNEESNYLLENKSKSSKKNR